MKKSIFLAAIALFALAGCATGNSYLADRSTTVEMYHIFDIKTKASTGTVAKAAADGLTQNTSQLSQVTPLQMGKTVPTSPGRFTIEDVGAKLSGTGMGTLLQLASMQNGGLSMKSANCSEAVWTSRAERSIPGSNNLTLYSCLYKYQAGYQLDTYAVFQKTEGGLTQFTRDITSAVVGTPEHWVNKTILDTVRFIEKATGAKVVRLEGQPELAESPS